MIEHFLIGQKTQKSQAQTLQPCWGRGQNYLAKREGLTIFWHQKKVARKIIKKKRFGLEKERVNRFPLLRPLRLGTGMEAGPLDIKSKLPINVVIIGCRLCTNIDSPPHHFSHSCHNMCNHDLICGTSHTSIRLLLLLLLLFLSEQVGANERRVVNTKRKTRER